MKRPQRLDFLQGDPRAVEPGKANPSGTPRQLPDAIVTRLMAIEGVDGVWIEELGGQPEVVVYLTRQSAVSKVPTMVAGMPVRPQLGEPIRTQELE